MPTGRALLTKFRRRSGSGGQSLPYSVSGLAADFDADNLLASLSDSDPVTTWADATGGGNDVGNTGANRPTFDAVNPQFNGHASVNFAKASTQYLFGASLPICTALSGADVPLTVLVVVRRPNKLTTAEQMIWSLGNSGSGTQSYIAGSYHDMSDDRQVVRMRMRDDAGTAESTPRENTRDLTDLGPQVLAFSLSGTAAAAYVVGSSQNPRYDATVNAFEVSPDYSGQGAITFDRFALGVFLRSTASLPCEMEVARVLVYTRELSASERATVCDYLWSRYCRPPVLEPSADLPTELATGLVHHWRMGAGGASLAGQPQASFNDSIGGKHFTQAAEANQPLVIAHNGWGALRFDGVDDVMTAGVAADWTGLHDGSDRSLFVVYRVASTANALVPILDTVDNDTVNNTGIGLYHDAASGAHSLQIKIGATNVTAVVNHDSQDYGSRPDAWHVVELTCEATHPTVEEDYQIWLDNELYAAYDEGVAPSGSASANTLTLGALAGGGAFGGVDVAEILVFDRKLGRPGQSQAIGEYLARKWNTSHAALVGGNGFPATLNDAASHRGFPALCQDAAGVWHAIYRRGATHGSSRGVGVQCDSGDGLQWSRERVIYDVDDADGRDFRGECGFILLRQGAHAGRLLVSTKWSADDSNIQVAGVPSTLLIGTSDDNAGSWTWADPLDGKAILASLDYTASPNGLIELQSGPYAGRVLFTFTTSETGEGTGDQDIRLVYSDDGGATWSEPVVVLHRDSVAWRATEQHIVEFASGKLLMLIRDDTNHDIYSIEATVEAPLSWSSLANRFDGWGRPVCAVDPNDPAGLFVFYRSAASDLASWRYSDDEGATWSAERALSNLHATTGMPFGSYAGMAYAFPAVDSLGNLWLIYGLEDGTADSDVFVRRWADAEA